MQIGRGYSLNLKMAMYGPRLNPSINIVGVPIVNLAKRPYDTIDISKEARNLYLESIDKKSSDIRTASVGSEMGKDENNEYKDFDVELIKISSKYKSDIDKIKSSDLNDEEKSKHIERIKKSYTDEIHIKVDEVAKEFENYFDAGQELLQKYSEEEVKDLFDGDKFKEKFKSKALELVEEVSNSSKTQSTKSIYSRLVNKSKESVDLDDMDFMDVSNLHKAINNRGYNPSLEIDARTTLGTRLALVENSKNEFIDSLHLSDNIKTAMNKVNGRISEASMRHKAYKEEYKKHQEEIKAINENLAYVAKKFKRIENIIKDREEEFGVNSKNKLLLNSLKDEKSVLQEQIKFENQKEELEEKFRSLSTNKSKITGFDSYKRKKANYDEIKILDEEDDEDKESDDKKNNIFN